MDKSLSVICDALKKIANLLKPQLNPVSFILLTGKLEQGKTTLLNQSHLKNYPLESESTANIFYNNQSVILELGEAWLNQSASLLSQALQQLNKCHSNLKISGLILCIDCKELLMPESEQLIEHCRAHAALINRFAKALDYSLNLSLIFTKLDTLIGFCEFFQTDQDVELIKPLGFTLNFYEERNKLLTNFRSQFHQMTDVLSQQVLKKLHPTRSGAKRTLIREFPLQLASLQIPIQTFIQNIPLSKFKLHAIYFTSSEQGGLSVDKLNAKIQHEYALVIQDKYSQSNNYRAYFIEGALQNFIEHCFVVNHKITDKQKLTIGLMAGLVIFILSYIGYLSFQTSSVLDEASKELLRYESLLAQSKTNAYYHLSLAETQISKLSKGLFTAPGIKQLNQKLQKTTNHQLTQAVLPELITTLEAVIKDPAKSNLERYKALKVYLMFTDANHFSAKEIESWFNEYWQDSDSFSKSKSLVLLRKILSQPLAHIDLNMQLVVDVRNYLNALPAAYLYYSLAKGSFPLQTTEIAIEGFSIPTKVLPSYYTKAGFHELKTLLPNIAKELQKENWVLARLDLDNLYQQLEEAYCFDYVNWWQSFIQHTQLQHYQSYQQARALIQNIQKSRAFFNLTALIQEHTRPESNEDSAVFNQKIASQFTQLNLMSSSALTELAALMTELDKYLTTISLVKDNGQTVFDLTRARFQNDNQTDPLSVLYAKARSLPEPVASWAKQLADDTWFIFITEARNFINKSWEVKVYEAYQANIADRYPLNSLQKEEISIENFDLFFSPSGTLNSFVSTYLKPFLDTSKPQWQPKEANGYILPLSTELINELIRANIISNMFFADDNKHSKILFSLQKINLDPVIANFQLAIGKTLLTDTQDSQSSQTSEFSWPTENAKLQLHAVDGQNFSIEEKGVWAFFKLLQKVNVLVDSADSASLQILFEINGNSGRYLLKTQNLINPFSPGILTGFALTKSIA